MEKNFGLIPAAGILGMGLFAVMFVQPTFASADTTVDQKENSVTIGNENIERTFSLEDGLNTVSVTNKRINDTLKLLPAAGSEDFIIHTLGSNAVVNEQTKELSRGKWSGSIYGESEENAADASALFDGNDETENSDVSGDSTYPYTLFIDLGESRTFQSFSFQKRKGNTNEAWGINGTPGKYKIQVSTGNKEWTDAGSGEFTKADYNLHAVGNVKNAGDKVYANLKGTQTARYVRLISESGAFGNDGCFVGAEFRLYDEQMEKVKVSDGKSLGNDGLKASQLNLKDTKVEEIENGKKLQFIFQPKAYKGSTWTVNYNVELKNDDQFMRSYIELNADDPSKAKLDYIETDHFVLPSDVAGLWSRPDYKVPNSAYSFPGELMTLGQPIYADGLYFGSEFPASDTFVADDTMNIRYYSGKSLAEINTENGTEETAGFTSWKNVIGAGTGIERNTVQTAFYDYIDSIAAKTEFRRQYNSWYDNRMAITENSVKEAFLGAEKGFSANGFMPLDAYVVDDGWNNYNDPTYTGIDEGRAGSSYNRTGFWEFNDKFPNELYPSMELTHKLQSSFGLWLGPQGGYELQNTFAQYLASQRTGFADPGMALGTVIDTGSKRYIDNLTTLFKDYEDRFDIDYLKLDGFASRVSAQKDSEHITGGENGYYFVSEFWNRWTKLFDNIRQERAAQGKGLFINATCYVPVSPWMLQWVNTIWMQNAGDDEQDASQGGDHADIRLTGRDNRYFDNYEDAQLQFPMKNVYNHDPIYGVSASNQSMDTDAFRRYLMGNAVRGTQFWELYFSPSIMDDEKWEVASQVISWAKENSSTLEKSKFFGSRPSTGEVYGYSAWNKNKGVLSLRNPSNETKEYTLRLNEEIGAAPSVKDVAGVQILPYENGRTKTKVSYGDAFTVTLAPHELRIYQFGAEDSAAPEIVSQKNTADKKIQLKFDEKISSDTDISIVGNEVASSRLLPDYQTVEITAKSTLPKDTKVIVNKVTDLYGNQISQQLEVKAYKDNVIVEANGKSDLKASDNLKNICLTRSDNQMIQFDGKSHQIAGNDSLSGKEAFGANLLVRTTDKGKKLVEQSGAFTISIDNEGYLSAKVGNLILGSREETSQVSEKAHGTFGTKDYVPTKTQTVIKGEISDGKLHSVTLAREVNGMVKLYLDGELSATAYQEQLEELKPAAIIMGDDGFEGLLSVAELRNNSIAYDEAKQFYTSLNLSDRLELDRSGWKASASSAYADSAAEGSAEYAIDGNLNTLWHTDYAHDYPKPIDHWLRIDFDQAEEVSQVVYTGREKSSNGNIKDYELVGILPDDSQTTLASGTFEDGQTGTIDFKKTQLKGFILKRRSSYGPEPIHAAAAEIQAFDFLGEIADFDALEQYLAGLEKLDEKSYTAESYKDYEDTLKGLEKLFAAPDASQSDVDLQKELLFQAQAGLKKKDDSFKLGVTGIQVVKQGKTLNLAPAGISAGQIISYTFSKEGIVSVDEKGILTALKPGMVKVAAKAGDETAAVTVRVTQ